MVPEQQQQPTAAVTTEADAVKQIFVKSSLNVPGRLKNRAAKKASSPSSSASFPGSSLLSSLSKSPSGSSLQRLESFHDLPDYLRDNE